MKAKSKKKLSSKQPLKEKKKLKLKDFYLNIVIYLLCIIFVAPTMNGFTLDNIIAIIIGPAIVSLIIGYLVKLVLKIVKNFGDNDSIF